MSTTPEALAAQLEAWAKDYSTTDYTDEMATKAATELRRLAAVEAERDDLRYEIAEMKREFATRGGMLELVKQRRDELEAERDQLRAEVEALRAGAVSPQRAELVAAWNDLPDSIRCHPGLKRLFRACQVA